ncbi:MAG TPA: gluconokinase [Nitrospiraceae bacterium]|nr:gluconokinase [Nitrospiraceae bacterium]
MIVLIMGVSGSGKSTIGRRLADALHADFVEADSFHSHVNLEKMRAGTPLSEHDREPWLHALRAAIDRWIREEQNVVLACSALTAASRRILIPDRRSIALVYLKGSFDLIQARLAQRQHPFMPRELLASQFDILEEPTDAFTIDAAWPPDTITARIKEHLGPAFS